MDVNTFNNFATTWQQLITAVKISFTLGTVTATHGFKQSYKFRTGEDFSMQRPSLKTMPIAVEPMKSRCRTAAVGCYIFMPNGHVYEGIIRVAVGGDKELVHLVWFCAEDATKRPLIQMDNCLFKESKAAVSDAKALVPKEREGD